MYQQLNKLYYLRMEVEQLQDEIKELTVLSAVQYSDMPHGSMPSSPTEKFVERMITLKERLSKKLEQYYNERDRVEQFIEEVPDPEIRVIMRKRYCEHKSWQQIGEEMYQDRTTCYKKLRRYEQKNFVDIQQM